MFESLYQSFEDLGGPQLGAARVKEFRRELERRKLTGFVVPRSDEHQNEYVPTDAERLLWLTGFSGSAGIAIVLKDRAALFVDGRYTEQAKAQVDGSVFDIVHLAEDTPSGWMQRTLSASDRIGYDPRLHTPEAVSKLQAACDSVGASLAAVEPNPVDSLWSGRPEPAHAFVVRHKAKFAGESAAAKIARVRDGLKNDAGLLVSDPQNLAWLLNIRAADVPHTPAPLGYAYVPKEGPPVTFLDESRLSPGVSEALREVSDIAEPKSLIGFVRDLGKQGERVLFDRDTISALLTKTFEEAGGRADIGVDPVTLMKAVKNKAELAGARAAQIRDGAAVARFLAWFDAESSRGRLTEIDAVKALETFRRATGALKDVSFPTIAGAGPNSAIPHYRVTNSSNRQVEPGIFLIDSGAQYEDGTTDITRTVAVGRPKALWRDRFTRVLKGHIAIARAVFPEGATGAQIDTMARLPLWRVGLDFDHGTGHGVGSYLSVHEGPQRISKTGATPLVPGMILSNEPGYYLPGSFGIRIENLVVVEPRAVEGAERKMLGFETLTLAPIDLRLVDVRLMDEDEIKWLDSYHARVRRTLSPLVDKETRNWLARATRRLASVSR